MTQICNSCLKNNKYLYTSYIIENIDIDEDEEMFDKYINIHKKNLYFTILIVNFR